MPHIRRAPRRLPSVTPSELSASVRYPCLLQTAALQDVSSVALPRWTAANSSPPRTILIRPSVHFECG